MLMVSITIVSWYTIGTYFLTDWKKLTSVLSKLIAIRDGYKKCDGLTCDDVNAFILDLCTN